MSRTGVYCSYLLRMWHVPNNGDYPWRIILENIKTGEKHGFSSLPGLFAFLSALSIEPFGEPGEGSQSEVQG